jgi:hypothetical protein
MLSKTFKMSQNYKLKILRPESNRFSIKEPHIILGQFGGAIPYFYDDGVALNYPAAGQAALDRINSCFAPSQYSHEEGLLGLIVLNQGVECLSSFEIDDKIWKEQINYIMFPHGTPHAEKENGLAVPGTAPELLSANLQIDEYGNYFHGLLVMTKKAR